MRLMISFAALFLSVIFLQLCSGSIGPLDALSGLAEGFGTTEIGLLGSAHFVGFFVGCWWAPRLMGTVGHNRAFAAFAATGAIGAMAHPLWVDPLAWCAMRALIGLSVAGCYTVVEAWLQAKVTNETRGRALGAYRVVDLGASLVAQLMIAVLEPASYVSYNILAILCCAALLPLMLTTSIAPTTPAAPRLRPIAAIRLSPLAAAGVMVAGVSSPSFRMVGPVYGEQMGLDLTQIAWFLAAAILGGALAQVPAGWLADRFDRRLVLIGLSAAATAVCFAIASLPAPSPATIYVMSLLFGVATFPVYSISTAHANDFATPEQAVELSSGLMFLFGLGAIASPLLGSALIAAHGAPALFAMIAGAHVLLILFGFWRMRAGVPAHIRTAYRYMPRTSFLVGRLMRRRDGG